MSSSPGSPIPLFKMRVEERGRIKDIKEIIVRIEGLPSCLYGQLLDMGDGVRGIVMGFDETEVLALALGDPSKLRLGKQVSGISQPFKIPAGKSILGRVVNAMGEPLDNGPVMPAEVQLPVFMDSPPIIHRGAVGGYLPSGTKIVDILAPLAKGQRQLILGDRVTGKTSVAMDAILSQKGRNVVCGYCCIGKSASSLEKIISTFHRAGAFEYTFMVVAFDNSPVGEQYIAPYASASIGDYFALQGRDVLMVFDDLTKHAWAYRQLSLLLERPPGREAYPGDIFYVQVQLMERAGKFNEKHGSGSMTFIAIAETLQGDLTGYIPSNLSSMCDGQICLSSSIFAEGFRPAIDVPFSISIIGGKGQPMILRSLSENLRADYAKYEEIVKLSRLSSGVSEEADRTVRRGEIIRDILQQMENSPVSLQEEVLLLYALQRGWLMKLDRADRLDFCKNILAFGQENAGSVLKQIGEDQELTVEIEKGLESLMEAYFKGPQP